MSSGSLSPLNVTSGSRYKDIKLTNKFGSRGTTPGKFNRPWDVATVGSVIIVADRDNHCIQVFSLEGVLITSFGGYGTGQGQFNCPMGVATNRNGDIVVADCYNNRVQVFSSEGKFLRSFGSQGTKESQFHYPNDVATTKEGNIPVADYANDRVQVFDSNGAFLFKFGVSTPSGVCVTSEGDWLVTDNTHNCIRKFNSTGQPIGKFGNEGSGQAQFKCSTYCPLSVTVDIDDCIFVTDPDNHRVQIFTKDGSFLNQITGDEGFSPFGVAVSAHGHIVVADGGNNCVVIYNAVEPPK